MAEENTQSVLDMPDDEFLAKEAEIMKNSSEEAKPSSENTTSTQEVNSSENTESTNKEVEQPDKEENEPVDYEAFYKEVTAPFVANGKTISAKNSKEIISLMQMGSDYTRKTQQLSSKRKILNFLEKEKLMDEHKLEMLADIANGNTAALKKLIKDKQIDVLQLESFDDDEDQEKEYIPQARMPSDAVMALDETVAEIAKKENGLNLLREFQRTYDPQSIKMIENNPKILNDLYDHNSNGIYKKIKDEFDRRTAFNQMNPNIPFLVAYSQIYNEMYNNAQLQPQQPVTTQPYFKNSQQSINNSQVKGAKTVSSRGTQTSSKKQINYLEMSDEEFLKQFGESRY